MTTMARLRLSTSHSHFPSLFATILPTSYPPLRAHGLPGPSASTCIATAMPATRPPRPCSTPCIAPKATAAGEVYAQAHRRGMDFVTLTDHDTIDGALQIAHRANVIVGEELTCWFPEDGCKMHVLVYGIDRIAPRCASIAAQEHLRRRRIHRATTHRPRGGASDLPAERQTGALAPRAADPAVQGI